MTEQTAQKTQTRFAVHRSGHYFYWSVSLPKELAAADRYEISQLGSGLCFTPSEKGGQHFNYPHRSTGKWRFTRITAKNSAALGLREPDGKVMPVMADTVFDPRTGRFIIHILPHALQRAVVITKADVATSPAEDAKEPAPEATEAPKPEITTINGHRPATLKDALDLVNELIAANDAEPIIENGRVRARLSLTI